MEFLFPQEQKMLQMVIARNPEKGKALEDAIKKIYIHLPLKLLNKKYDAKMVEEFLRELIKNGEKLGIEHYYNKVTEDDTSHTISKKCIVNGDLQKNIFKSLGSYGLTKLIRDVLSKMAEKDFSEQDVENLVRLIEARNKIRQNEEKFLEDAFRVYLKKQIALYNA